MNKTILILIEKAVYSVFSFIQAINCIDSGYVSPQETILLDSSVRNLVIVMSAILERQISENH